MQIAVKPLSPKPHLLYRLANTTLFSFHGQRLDLLPAPIANQYTRLTPPYPARASFGTSTRAGARAM
jgi:hypothetical protein